MCHTDLYHNLVPITKRFLLSKTASSYFSVKAVKPFTGFDVLYHILKNNCRKFPGDTSARRLLK